MRKTRPLCLLGTLLLIGAAAALAAPGAGPDAGGDSNRDALREKLHEAETPEEWESIARELLTDLDRRGLSHSPEAAWLVDRLLGVSPGDTVLLWRRAEAYRRSGAIEEAIADLEYLIETAPEHALAVRARRALPALFLRAQEPEKSAKADEALLEKELADPVAVSIRLAHTYETLGDHDGVQSALERLEQLDPGKLNVDPDLMWLDARAAALGTRGREAAEKLLYFANLHTRDPRRIEALVRAAELYSAAGQKKMAIGLLAEASASDGPEAVIMDAHYRLARLYFEIDQVDEAREQLEIVLDEALDPQTVASALRMLFDETERREGLEAAVTQAAALIVAGERFHLEMARNHLDRLVRQLEPELREDPAKALYYYDMLEDAGRESALSYETRLEVARLLEELGETERAEHVYRTVVVHFGPERQAARQGLLRTSPGQLSGEGEEEIALRIEALAKEEAWDEIRAVVTEGRLPQNPSEELLRIAARALFAAGEYARAEKLLARIENPGAAAAVLRGDARALQGDWDQACPDYSAASGAGPTAPLLGWVELRVAICEMRAGRLDAAQARLEALEDVELGPPAEFLSEEARRRWSAASRRARRPGSES